MMIEPYLATMKQRCAEQPHGTRSRYVSGCKCVPCRAANSRYQSGRFYAIRDGDWNGFVNAATARAWLADNMDLHLLVKSDKYNNKYRYCFGNRQRIDGEPFL